MKKLFVLIAVCLSFSFTHKPGPGTNPPDEATVYIYRTGQFTGAGSNWAMFLDGKKICKLSNNKFIKITVSKGKHTINSHMGGVGLFKKETEIEIDAEPGQNYYIACNIKQSITRARLELMEVTKSTADKQMKNMSLDNCQENIDEGTNK